MNLDFAAVKSSFEYYIEDLPGDDIFVFEAEFELWRRHWRSRGGEGIASIVHVLDELGPQRMFFPNIISLIEIYAILPVSVANVERSFSTLKIIKTYLRNRTGDERLSSLAMLSTHKSITSQLSPEKIVDLFATQNRRIKLID